MTTGRSATQCPPCFSRHRSRTVELRNDRKQDIEPAEYRKSPNSERETPRIMASHFRETFAHLPPPAECLAILVGCAEVTIFGLAGLASPVEFAKGYGLPLLSSSSAQKHPGALQSSSDEDSKASQSVQQTQETLVAAVAARNIQHGVLILAFALYWRDRKALGTVVAAGFVTTFADLLLVHWYGAKEAVFGHVIGIANCSLIGGALLWWGRNDKWW